MFQCFNIKNIYIYIYLYLYIYIIYIYIYDLGVGGLHFKLSFLRKFILMENVSNILSADLHCVMQYLLEESWWVSI